jgi:hypothetical protein
MGKRILQQQLLCHTQTNNRESSPVAAGIIVYSIDADRSVLLLSCIQSWQVEVSPLHCDHDLLHSFGYLKSKVGCARDLNLYLEYSWIRIRGKKRFSLFLSRIELMLVLGF